MPRHTRPEAVETILGIRWRAHPLQMAASCTTAHVGSPAGRLLCDDWKPRKKAAEYVLQPGEHTK